MRRRLSITSTTSASAFFPDVFDSYRNEHGQQITVEMKRPSFTAEAYNVYYEYQTGVFGERGVNEDGYKSFLVATPLIVRAEKGFYDHQICRWSSGNG